MRSPRRRPRSSRRLRHPLRVSSLMRRLSAHPCRSNSWSGLCIVCFREGARSLLSLIRVGCRIRGGLGRVSSVCSLATCSLHDCRVGASEPRALVSAFRLLVCVASLPLLLRRRACRLWCLWPRLCWQRVVETVAAGGCCSCVRPKSLSRGRLRCLHS